MKMNEDAILEDQIVFRRNKFRNVKRLLRRVFWCGLIFAGVFGTVRWIHHSTLFSVGHFEVVGLLKQRTTADIIRSSQIGLRKSLFSTSLDGVREQLLQDPWIRNATVRRIPPKTIWMHVTEYTPVALCLLDRLYFVSVDGILFKPLEQESVRNLPVLTGLQKSEPEMIQRALALVKLFENEFTEGHLGVSEIHYDESRGFSLVTVNEPVYLHLGFENFPEKLGRFGQILAFARKKEQKLSRVDLDYKDRAYIKGRG